MGINLISIDIVLTGLSMLIHRADHSLEDLKVKLFGSKREKTQAPAVFSSVAEAIPSFPLEGKRKERSLSSLVISTPKIGTKQINQKSQKLNRGRERNSQVWRHSETVVASLNSLLQRGHVMHAASFFL